MAAAEEHHPKARGTGDGGQSGFTIFAERLVGRSGGAAHRAIESLRIHKRTLPVESCRSLKFKLWLVRPRGTTKSLNSELPESK
jgi:hypothetical protein